MNRIRFIEGATLAAIGIFCASATLSVVLQTGNRLPAHDTHVAMVELPAVTIVAKRMNAAEKADSLRAEQQDAVKSVMVEHDKNLTTHAG